MNIASSLAFVSVKEKLTSRKRIFENFKRFFTWHPIAAAMSEIFLPNS